MPVTISQACSSALSHWLSYFVGRTMLYDYYSRGFEKSGKEYAVLQYYTICGIALSCLPHAWKAVHLHIGIDSTNPLLSPSLWSFLSIFLFSYVSTRRLGYYAIVLFALSTTTMFSDIEVTHDTTNVKFPELYSALVELFDKPEVLRVLALVVMGTFIFALVAEFFILLTSKERDPRISDKKSQSLQNERILRAKNFPPIYPNGWYRAFNSEDIQIGESKYIKIFGKDIAVFRGEDGKVNAIDAFCPHLGANLGIGGKVKGNCVECPFHGWKFDGKGTCTSIPYTTSKIPNAANTNSWPVHEYADMICIFYHCEGEEPDYFPIPLPEIDNGSMARYHIWQSDLDMHIQDFAENAADYAHFNYVHDDLSIPFGAGLFYITHKVVWHSGTPSDSSQTRFSYFTDDTRVHCKFLFNIPLPQYVQPIVLFNGPSIVYFRFITPLGDILLLKTFQALGPLKVKVQDRIYADRLIPSFLVRFVVTQSLHAFLDDVIIWENKSYSFRPCIVKGDGPMGKVRRWFSQFYTENSITVKQEKQNNKKTCENYKCYYTLYKITSKTYKIRTNNINNKINLFISFIYNLKFIPQHKKKKLKKTNLEKERIILL